MKKNERRQAMLQLLHSAQHHLKALEQLVREEFPGRVGQQMIQESRKSVPIKTEAKPPTLKPKEWPKYLRRLKGRRIKILFGEDLNHIGEITGITEVRRLPRGGHNARLRITVGTHRTSVSLQSRGETWCLVKKGSRQRTSRLR